MVVEFVWLKIDAGVADGQGHQVHEAVLGLDLLVGPGHQGN